MITFRDIGYMGRLGNQMFQFASTLGISDKIGHEARFPLENCFTPQSTGPFDPKTGSNMDVKCDLLDCFDINPIYFIPSHHLTIDSLYQETSFTYDQKYLDITGNPSLHGYFQTEKYFSHIRDLVLSQFSFKIPYMNSAESYIQTIRNENKNAVIASIHVRRGDYVMHPDHHPPCSSSYYINAAEELKKLNSNTIFLIFSDDIEWCRSEFDGPSYIISNLENPYTEMCAMSLCDHNIIANSSFSWWGAWLNVNPDKIVIAPSRWFGDLIQKDVSDIYCKNWKIL